MKKKKEEPVVTEVVQDVLPCTPVDDTAELSKEHLQHLLDCKDAALKIAEDTQDRLRAQLNQQVELYNKDMEYMSALNRNSIQYTRAKEDALLKILEGVTTLITIDRMPIVPETPIEK